MQNIEIKVIAESDNPAGMMMFLARLTQRGHKVKSMNDLVSLYYTSNKIDTCGKAVGEIAKLPHGTIKRFTPITIAIVGASRRFLAQARTHQVGMTYVSASLQYSDYTDKADFVVPYAITEADHCVNLKMRDLIGECNISTEDRNFDPGKRVYLDSCKASMVAYKEIARFSDNDTAGYAAPQGLRNILIIQGNHESWMNFIRTRACNRNTNETQYVTMLIWQMLLETTDGAEMFKYAGPDCSYGQCREGKMSCGSKLGTNPTDIINEKWPLLRR